MLTIKIESNEDAELLWRILLSILTCNSREKVINLEIDCQVDVDWSSCLELTKQSDQSLSTIKELEIFPYSSSLKHTVEHLVFNPPFSTPPPLNMFQIESTCLVMRLPHDLLLISKIRSKSVQLSIPSYHIRSHTVVQAFVSKSCNLPSFWTNFI